GYFNNHSYSEKNYTYFRLALFRVIYTLFTMIAFDVAVLYLVDGHLYFGQVVITCYHNPTIQVLEPIAAFQFLLVARVFRGKPPVLGWFPLILAASTILSGLAKPSYNLCI